MGGSLALGEPRFYAERDHGNRSETKNTKHDHRYLPAPVGAQERSTQGRTNDGSNGERKIDRTQSGRAVTGKVVGRDCEKYGELHRLADAGGSAVDQHVGESASEDRQHRACGEECDSGLQYSLAGKTHEEIASGQACDRHSQRKDCREETYTGERKAILPSHF